MWGQDVCCHTITENFRIIPTRVGTSLRGDGWVLERKDHPHACGDKIQGLKQFFLHRGSSPRVWGQVTDEPSPDSGERIIPTRVGTRCAGMSKGAKEKDHPHACGDKSAEFIKRRSHLGSSPRVWGQGTLRRRLPHSRGIIPTRVGTSRSVAAQPNEERDHPHACGDKTKEIKENSGFAKSTA